MNDTSSLNLGSIDWAATVKITLARSLASTLIWCVVALFLNMVPFSGIPGFFFRTVMAIAIGAPLYHFMVRGVRAVLGGIPFVGLACNLLLAATSLLVAVGDPVVFGLNRQFPELIGITGFKPFNLVPAFFIYR